MHHQRSSLHIALIVIGFVSVVSQTLLIRELVGVFYGNELCLGIIFASWFFWMAVGSLGAERIFKQVGLSGQPFVLSQIIAAVLLPLTIIFIKTIRVFLHVPVGELMGYHLMVSSIPLLLAPLGMVIGAQFTLGCRFYSQVMKQENEEHASLAAGKVYLYDAIGDTLGGFAFGYIFIIFFNSLETAFYIGIINLFCGIILLIVYDRKILPIIICIACLLINVYGTFAADRLISYATSLDWRGFYVVENASSKYGELTMVKADNLYNCYCDGMLAFTSPQQLESEELIHFPLQQTPEVKQVLILGGAVAGGLKEALKYPGAEIYYVELDPALIKIALKYIPKEDVDSLNNSRVKNIHGDGRLFIKRWKGKPFDAVIVNIGSPSTAEDNRFYTLEFFEEAKRILKPQGVISLSVRSNENYLGENMLQFNGCIYHTLKQIFPHIILVPGDELMMIGSSENLRLSAEPYTLANRLKGQGIETRFVNEHYLSYRFSPERMGYIQESLDRVVPRINHDLYPVCYYFDIALWAEEFSQGTEWTEGTEGTEGTEKLFNILFDLKPWQFLSGIVLLTAMFMFRNSRACILSIPSIPAGVFVSGCGGIVMQMVLIIGFEILFGYIYHLMGLIIAGFMVGIAIGAWLMNARVNKIKNRVLVYSLLQAAVAMYLFLTPVIFYSLRTASANPLVQNCIPLLFFILIALAGVLIGLIFPIANRIYLGNAQEASPSGGIMYAMDMGGACVGSLIAAVLTIPVFGITWTCVIFGVLSLLVGMAAIFTKDTKERC